MPTSTEPGEDRRIGDGQRDSWLCVPLGVRRTLAHGNRRIMSERETDDTGRSGTHVETRACQLRRRRSRTSQGTAPLTGTSSVASQLFHGPRSRIRPPLMTAAESQIRLTTSISWVMSRTVSPRSLLGFRMRSRICAVVSGSSADVASSLSRTEVLEDHADVVARLAQLRASQGGHLAAVDADASRIGTLQ